MVQSNSAIFINSPKVEITPKYSQAVILSSNMTLLKSSGIIGANVNGELIISSPREQIQQTFDNIKAIIDESGAGINDIVEIETVLLDSSYFDDYVSVRRTFFHKRIAPRPISKTYYAKGLINPEAIVEIAVTVALPEKTSKSSVHVTAIVVAREGKEDDLMRLLQKNLIATRNEKGCLSYEIFQSTENKKIFTLHEKWTSNETLSLHFKMPYMIEHSLLGNQLIDRTEIITSNGIE